MALFETALVSLGLHAAQRSSGNNGDVRVVLSGGFKAAIPYVYLFLSAVATFRDGQHWKFLVEFEEGTQAIEIPAAAMSELVRDAAKWAVEKTGADVNLVAERVPSNPEANRVAARSVVRNVNGQWELSPLGRLVAQL
jgi:hypothetical protein